MSLKKNNNFIYKISFKKYKLTRSDPERVLDVLKGETFTYKLKKGSIFIESYGRPLLDKNITVCQELFKISESFPSDR